MFAHNFEMSESLFALNLLLRGATVGCSGLLAAIVWRKHLRSNAARLGFFSRFQLRLQGCRECPALPPSERKGLYKLIACGQD
jgi:hypothetical protein